MSEVEDFWRQAVIPAKATVQQAIHALNEAGLKIVMVVNDNGQLEGTISDGDIRRGLLKGLDINDAISSIIHRNALVAPIGMGRDLVMQLMHANKVQQIP